jgi:hypothetical protein
MQGEHEQIFSYEGFKRRKMPATASVQGIFLQKC